MRKARQNVELDRAFLRVGNLSRAERARYLLEKYRSIATGASSVRYLGAPFAYDNRWTPAMLQNYPDEILKLDRLIDFSSVRNVLDVGANIGQFAATATAMFPGVQVWSLEPNPAVLPLLRRNSTRSAAWKVVPFGLSAADEHRSLHFVPGKSGQGSMHRDNASLGLLGGDAAEVTVDLRRLTHEVCENLGMPTSYDLVKVDVEGFEAEALAGLRDVRWRFLAVEASVARSGGTSLENMRALVAELWGSGPGVLDEATVSAASPTQEVLFVWRDPSAP
jgi:FkbM family methyltransferase